MEKYIPNVKGKRMHRALCLILKLMNLSNKQATG